MSEDMFHTTLLSHGSIISVRTEENSIFRYQLQFKVPKSMPSKTLGSTIVGEGDEDVSQYLLSARDLPMGISDSSDHTLAAALEHDNMLNLLPASTMPSKEYLNCITKLEDRLMPHVSRKSSDAWGVDSNYRNVIVFGDRGEGKTHFCVTLSARLRMTLSCTTIFLDCRQLQSAQTRMEQILHELTAVFKQAFEFQPSILILDNLDDLIPNTGASHSQSDDSAQHHNNPMLVSQSKLLADHLRFLMSGLNRSNVAILCTCVDENKLHKSLRSIHTFTSKVKVPSLGEVERFDMFLNIIRQHGPCPPCEELNLKDFTKRTEGFLPRDLKVVAARVNAKQRISFLSLHPRAIDGSAIHNTSIKDDIDRIISQYTPLTQQALQLERTKSPLKWSNIGGLFEAKLSLSAIVLRPIKYRTIYRNAPISLPRGLLLYGFPGCGKSCIVPALAEECGFNLVTCRGPELLDKYIGASEAKVRKLFEKAYACAPSILFLDEFDALAPRRGSDNTGVTDRVVNQLLTFLDGVEVQRTDDKMVYIVAASSRPDKIDPALLRPGRLEKHLFVGYTTSDEEWNDLLSKISETRDVDEETKVMIIDGSFQRRLYENHCPFRKLSAADIKGVFDTAHLSAVHDLLRIQSEKSSTDAAKTSVTINCGHLLDAFLSARPFISEADRRMFSRVFTPFLGLDKTNVGEMEGLGLDPMSFNTANTTKLMTALK